LIGKKTTRFGIAFDSGKGLQIHFIMVYIFKQGTAHAEFITYIFIKFSIPSTVLPASHSVMLGGAT
jgi:hypothetical protein